jgi:hypothetical protein
MDKEFKFVTLFVGGVLAIMILIGFNIEEGEAGRGNRLDAVSQETWDATFNVSTTATHTHFILYDVDNGQTERVSVGAEGSGGVGFKLLRIAN